MVKSCRIVAVSKEDHNSILLNYLEIPFNFICHIMFYQPFSFWVLLQRNLDESDT